MNLKNVRGGRLPILVLLLTLALIFSACGNNGGEVEVEEPVITGEDVTETEADVTEEETDVEAETEVEAETDVVTEDEADTVETEVETQVITDTDVITQTEVITEADVTGVITETTVLTDVTVEEDTVVDTEVMTETEDLGTETSPVRVQGTEEEGAEAGFVIVVLADAAGNQLLADEAEGRPLFVYTGDEEGLIENENFEPVGVDENISISQDLDPALFGQVDQDGFQQLTVNGLPLYRFTGDETQMLQVTQENEFAPLTSEGEIGQLSAE